VCAVVGGLAFALFSSSNSADRVSIKALIEEVRSREIYQSQEIETDDQKFVQYDYIKGEITSTVDENEVVALRQETSYTKKIGAVNEGTKDERPILQYVGYSRPKFLERNGKWYEIERATTTPEVFTRAIKPMIALPKLFETAHAFTPVAGATRRIRSGDAVFPYDALAQCGIAAGNSGGAAITVGGGIEAKVTQNTAGPLTEVIRTFMPFNTSTIGPSDPITAASLSITNVNVPDNDEFDSVVLCETSQVDMSSVVTTDYDNWGTCALPQPLSIFGNPYVDTFTFTAGELPWIKRSGEASNCSATNGITCLGFRLDQSDNNCNIGFDPSTTHWNATGGTATFTVTYVGGPSFVPWQFQDF
jgi:hypothetical protein